MTAVCRPAHNGHVGDGLCDPCTAQLIGWLTDLPHLCAELDDNLEPGQRSPFVSGGHSSSSSWAAPLRVTVLDHTTLIGITLTTWAGRIAEQRRITPPHPGNIGFHLTHAPWSAGRVWAGTYAAEIRGLWGPAMGLTQSWPAPPDHAPGVPCRRCDYMTLYRTVGADGWRCNREGCWHWISDVTYQQIVNTRAAVARQAA